LGSILLEGVTAPLTASCRVWECLKLLTSFNKKIMEGPDVALATDD